MRNTPEILTVIDGEYAEWIPLKQISDEVKVAEDVKKIYCDTRDFALGWNFKKLEPFKKPECGLEVRSNEGIARIRRIEHSPALGNYLIEPGEIVPWLKKLCEKSGGYDKDWRILNANIEGCRGWDIKYIRFVRHESGRFVVCNAYWYPIKWRVVYDNIKFE